MNKSKHVPGTGEGSVFKDDAPVQRAPHQQTALREMRPITPGLPMTDAQLQHKEATQRQWVVPGPEQNHKAVSLGQGCGKLLVPPENLSQGQGPAGMPEGREGTRSRTMPGVLIGGSLTSWLFQGLDYCPHF